eukprot:PhF_6_TR9206/c2_g2_i1/m.14430
MTKEKEVIGLQIHVKSSFSSIDPGNPVSVRLASANLSNASRFEFLGNNTASYTIRCKEEVSKFLIQDIQNVVMSTVVTFDNPELFLTDPWLSVVLQWNVIFDRYEWCPVCHRPVGGRNTTLSGIPEGMTYDVLAKRERGLAVVSTLGWVCGFVILNRDENEFIRRLGWSGLICGKYDMESKQWKWGCSPAIDQPIGYTNWANKEPSFENDSACVYVQPDGTWKVWNCEVESELYMWHKTYFKAGGPYNGYITFGGPVPVHAIATKKLTGQNVTLEARVGDVVTVNVRNLIPLSLTVTDRVVYYMETNVTSAFIDVNQGIVTATLTDDIIVDLRLKVFWGIHSSASSCPFNSKTIVDPVRGRCLRETNNSSRQSAIAILGRYDWELFSDNPNYASVNSSRGMVSVCSVGDGSGL